MSAAPVDPVIVDLATLLRCPGCGGSIAASSASLTCTACGRQMPIVDGVPQIRDAGEDPAIERERRAVLELETGGPVSTPPGSTDFSLPVLLGGPGPARSAFMSLPYDDGSAFFRENEYFRNVAGFASSFDHLVDHLELAPGSRVLDIGADLTWSTARLAKRGWRAVGIDINHHLVASRVFRDAGIDYAVANMDMHLAAFADGVFDGITAFNALHHTHRLEPLIANIARMVKPGGRLGFVEPYWFHEAVRQAFGASQIEAGINENVYRLEEWHQMVVRHGFELRSFAPSHAMNAVYVRIPDGAAPRVLSLHDASEELFGPFYGAALLLRGPAAIRAGAGAAVDVPIRVVNESAHTWCSEGQIPVHASYHLFEGGDETPRRMVAFENPRTRLREFLAPGTSVDVDVRVIAPSAPGVYMLQLDLVHEGVRWFVERGLPPVWVTLTVGD